MAKGRDVVTETEAERENRLAFESRMLREVLATQRRNKDQDDADVEKHRVDWQGAAKSVAVVAICTGTVFFAGYLLRHMRPGQEFSRLAGVASLLSISIALFRNIRRPKPLEVVGGLAIGILLSGAVLLATRLLL